MDRKKLRRYSSVIHLQNYHTFALPITNDQITLTLTSNRDFKVNTNVFRTGLFVLYSLPSVFKRALTKDVPMTRKNTPLELSSYDSLWDRSAPTVQEDLFT